MAEENFDENQIAQELESGQQRARLQQVKVAEPSKIEAEVSKQSSKLLKQGWQQLATTFGLSIVIVWLWYFARWSIDGLKKVLVRPGGEWIPDSFKKEERYKAIQKVSIVEDMGSGCCCFGCFMTVILIGVAIYILLNPIDFGLGALFG